ncbi:hypothetical protein BJY01DRAFT_57493 [Aspergillus pseudoustus]|uniref:Uncharacterized protein n=1 Tax=Aspergillus pseudoustus TaxID=1810923 RepID=A0ABR4KPS5_9EURO
MILVGHVLHFLLLCVHFSEKFRYKAFHSISYSYIFAFHYTITYPISLILSIAKSLPSLDYPFPYSSFVITPSTISFTLMKYNKHHSAPLLCISILCTHLALRVICSKIQCLSINRVQLVHLHIPRTTFIYSLILSCCPISPESLSL